MNNAVLRPARVFLPIFLLLAALSVPVSASAWDHCSGCQTAGGWCNEPGNGYHCGNSNQCADRVGRCDECPSGCTCSAYHPATGGGCGNLCIYVDTCEINGVCDNSHAGGCSSGTASAVTTSGSTSTWTCYGGHTGTCPAGRVDCDGSDSPTCSSTSCTSCTKCSTASCGQCSSSGTPYRCSCSGSCSGHYDTCSGTCDSSCCPAGTTFVPSGSCGSCVTPGVTPSPEPSPTVPTPTPPTESPTPPPHSDEWEYTQHYKCIDEGDLCKQVSCNGVTYYCTNEANGQPAPVEWRLSDSCDDHIACSYNSRCYSPYPNTDSPGTCGRLQGYVVNYTCNDDLFYDSFARLVKIRTNSLCSGTLTRAACSPHQNIYTCSAENHTLCWNVTGGGFNWDRNVYDNTDAKFYSCSNYTLNWQWYHDSNYLKCYDENICTGGDTCTSLATYYNDDSGRCTGSTVPSVVKFILGGDGYLVNNQANLCVDASGNTLASGTTTNPDIEAYGVCCWKDYKGVVLPNPYGATGAETPACQNSTVIFGVRPHPSCLASISCTSYGQLGYVAKPSDTVCGVYACPEGTVGVGDCSLTCGEDRQCKTAPTSCQCIAISGTGATDVAIRAPLGTRSNQTQIFLTTYVKGQLVCSPSPVVVYTLSGETKAATQVGACDNGIYSFMLDTRVPGNYLITVSFDAGADGTVARSVSINRFSDEARQSNVPDFDLSLLPLVAALSLMAARAGARRAGRKSG